MTSIPPTVATPTNLAREKGTPLEVLAGSARFAVVRGVEKEREHAGVAVARILDALDEATACT